MKRALVIATGVLLLAAGGLVYVSSRPGTLIYSLCHTRLGFSGHADLPYFMLYCLPDGLWCLASILVLHTLLRDVPLKPRLAFVSVVPALGIVSELMQGAGILCGVYDPLDLICYAIPIFVYYMLQISKETVKS